MDVLGEHVEAPGLGELGGTAVNVDLQPSRCCRHSLPLLATTQFRCWLRKPRLIGLESDKEEAAWLVAGWKRTLWSVTLPLVLPSVAAGFLLVFILSFLAEFSVPALLRVRVFATEIYTQFSAFYDFGAATAAASPLLVVILLIAFLIRWLLGERIVSSRRSLNSSPLMTPSSWLPFGQPLSVAVLMLGVLLPIASLAMKVDRPGTLWRSMDNSAAELGAALSCLPAAAVLAVALGFSWVIGEPGRMCVGRGWRMRFGFRCLPCLVLFWELDWSGFGTSLD